MNLGVYISTFNEDILIAETIKHVHEVFPQVEVIDLGSMDRTLMLVAPYNISVNRHVMPVKKSKHDPHGSGQEWTKLKNQYAAKHDWVFFIDGDEIFNVENLRKIKALLENPAYTAYRVGWKNIKDEDGVPMISNMIVNGAKIYKTSDYSFRRGWPNEVLQAEEGLDNRQPKEECEVWCWHGVLLVRSSRQEDTSRRKKRVSKLEQYNRELQWKELRDWPWM